MKLGIIRLFKALIILAATSLAMMFVYPIAFSILGLQVYSMVCYILLGAFFFFGVFMIILILVFGDGLMLTLEKWRTVQIAHSFFDNCECLVKPWWYCDCSEAMFEDNYNRIRQILRIV